MSAIPPYAGQDQTNQINLAAPVPQSEDGPGLMPPLPSNQEMVPQFLPPPVYKTDLWSAMQTWPL
jgi:hypothetical protein